MARAARAGHLDVVKYLVEEVGVDKENTSYIGCTPLGRAVQGDRTVVMEYLLDNGCGIEVTFHGLTPLHWAVMD